MKVTVYDNSKYAVDYENGIRKVRRGDFKHDPEVQSWEAAGNTPEIYREPEHTYAELRSAAYRAESDPLFIAARNEAIYDGTEPDYTEALAKVSEIKTRYPKSEGE